MKKVVTLEKNKEKLEAKGQKMGSKDSSRLIRNYKKREDSIKQGNQIFEEFRGVFLTCVQNRFSIGNPVVRAYVERKFQDFSGNTKAYLQLYNEREILNMQDDINAYKDRLFQSRIGDISGINSEDLRNESNMFTSQLVSNDQTPNTNLIKGAEVRNQGSALKESKTLDFKRKPVSVVAPKEMDDFDRISSIHNSSMAKDEEKKGFIDDDPFNFDAFDQIVKPTILTDSASKTQPLKSPMINFKTKMSSFKTQEYKSKDLPEPMSVREDPANTSRSKFDFDFGSFQPAPVQTHVNQANHAQPEQHRPATAPLIHNIEPQVAPPSYNQLPHPTPQYAQPQQEPVQVPSHRDINYHDPHIAQNHVQDAYDDSMNPYSNYGDTTEQEMQRIDHQNMYGQFDQGDNDNNVHTHQHQQEQPQHNYDHGVVHNIQPEHNIQPNAQRRPSTHNPDTQYPIHIEGNVSSDEEYTYY